MSAVDPCSVQHAPGVEMLLEALNTAWKLATNMLSLMVQHMPLGRSEVSLLVKVLASRLQ